MTISFRALDNNNDWMWGQGTGSYQTANAAIALDIKTALLSWVGNCWFSPNDFVDWQSRLDKNQFTALEAELSTVISGRQGVLSVNNISVNMVGRAFYATYDVTTIYSTIQETSLVGIGNNG